MRILQIISYLYPAWSYGGPGKLVYDLSLSLAKRGHQVTVYSTDAFDRDRKRDILVSPFPKAGNPQVRFFRNLSNTLAYRHKLFLPKEGYSVFAKELKAFDVIHTHEFFTPLTIMSNHVARKYTIPFVLSAHGTLDSFHLKHRSIVKQAFMKLFGKRILRSTTTCVAATPEEIEQYKALGIEKKSISFIRNGINANEFTKPSKGRFRKKYAISTRTKTLLYIGRIHKLKGLDMLVEGFAKLTREVPSVLIIAGSDDGYLDELRQRVHRLGISEYVIFPGKLFGKEKLEAFADTDVFVYPSPSEGFSIAILEAAAAGLPLLITEGCKFPEIEKWKAGCIIPYESNALHTQLKKMLKNDSFRKQAGHKAKKLVRNHFTIERMAENLENVYKKARHE